MAGAADPDRDWNAGRAWEREYIVSAPPRLCSGAARLFIAAALFAVHDWLAVETAAINLKISFHFVWTDKSQDGLFAEEN